MRREVFFKKLSGRIDKGGMNKKMHVLVNLGHSEDYKHLENTGKHLCCNFFE